jgi:predicted aconitase
MGYLGIIEKAGGRLLCDTCPVNMPGDFLKRRGHSIVATNSPKMAYYITGVQSLLPYYGSTQKCVQAAISGKWE